MNKHIKNVVISTVISIAASVVATAAVKHFKSKKDESTALEEPEEDSPSVRIYEDDVPEDVDDDGLNLKADAVNDGYKPVRY